MTPAKTLPALVIAFSLGLWSCKKTSRLDEDPGDVKPLAGIRDNVIVILADDLGWGELSSYGEKAYQTPTLDRLAREGARMTNFYSGSSVCFPARCSILTGMHTGHCSDRSNAATPLVPEERTIANYLQPAGYATATIGKWGLGGFESTGSPFGKGFEHFFGFIDHITAHNYYPEWVWNDRERFELPGNRSNFGVAVEKKTYVNDVFIEHAQAFIRDNAAKPFFLYLPLTLPHVNNELDIVRGNGMEVGPRRFEAPGDYTPRERGHAQMVLELDRSVRLLVETLKSLEIDTRTLILFVSDNGANNYDDYRDRFNVNGGLRAGKGSLYEGGIRMPLIAWMPGRIKPGQTIEEPWAMWDILPTITELAGLPTPSTDGRSFLGALRGDATPQEERDLYWELHFKEMTMQAIRRGRWKLVRHGGPGGTVELFDLRADPGEKSDLSAANPELAQSLEERLAELRTPSPRWHLGDKPSPLGPIDAACGKIGKPCYTDRDCGEGWRCVFSAYDSFCLQRDPGAGDEESCSASDCSSPHDVCEAVLGTGTSECMSKKERTCICSGVSRGLVSCRRHHEDFAEGPKIEATSESPLRLFAMDSNGGSYYLSDLYLRTGGNFEEIRLYENLEDEPDDSDGQGLARKLLAQLPAALSGPVWFSWRALPISAGARRLRRLTDQLQVELKAIHRYEYDAWVSPFELLQVVDGPKLRKKLASFVARQR